jgi:predicted alpha/beta-hydrolase family hydrolase
LIGIQTIHPAMVHDMKSEKVKIKIDDEGVSGVVLAPDSLNANSKTGLIFAHGAGNDMNHPLLVFVSQGLAEKGFITLRLNFQKKQKLKTRPDSQGKLIQTWVCVYDFLKSGYSYKCEKIIAVGKSMGGRVASQMIAQRLMDVDGLIFLGYPLHAPGKKDTLRDAHLYDIKNPVLFFAGTRDSLCDLSRLNGVLDKLICQWDLEIIEGGDHSFNLLKSDPRTQQDVHRQVLTRCLDWLNQISA